MTHTREPEIWLQWDDNEGEGIADCGCTLKASYRGSGAALFYCNTHAAVLGVLAALRDYLAAEDGYNKAVSPQTTAKAGHVVREKREAARAAIAKATQS